MPRRPVLHLAPLIAACVLFAAGTPGAHAQNLDPTFRCRDVAQLSAEDPSITWWVPLEGATFYAMGPLLSASRTSLSWGPGLPKARWAIPLQPGCEVLRVLHPDQDVQYDGGSTTWRFVLAAWGFGYVDASLIQPYIPPTDTQ